MSYSTQLPQSPAHKTAALEFSLDDLPSSFDTALNGPKAISGAIKAVSPAYLDPESFRRLSISTIS